MVFLGISSIPSWNKLGEGHLDKNENMALRKPEGAGENGKGTGKNERVQHPLILG